MTEAEIDHTGSDRSYSRDRSSDYYRDDYRKENYWGTQIRNIEIDIEIITETHLKIGIQTVTKMIIKTGIKTIIETGMMIGMRTIIKIILKTGIKTDYRDKYRDNNRDDSFDRDRGRFRERHHSHNSRKDNGFVSNNPRVEWLHKVLQQLSPDKVVAIQFLLASSVNFDDMFDSIYSPEDVDHLIAERIAYVKSQEVGYLAEDKSDENSSSINSQNVINYINHVIGELIDSVKDEKDTCYDRMHMTRILMVI